MYKIHVNIYMASKYMFMLCIVNKSTANTEKMSDEEVFLYTRNVKIDLKCK